mmetsp:Transcript_25703/g.48344  ORF Transcript_25703/g.48344 Transcript_25703/m.48344 type:complete len:259 (-) Transcript_25703:1008-1784(-)
MQEEAEVLVVLDFVLSNFDDLARAPLDDGTANHRHQNGVDVLVHVLNQQAPSVLNAGLQLLQNVGVAEPSDLQVPLGNALLALYPRNSLQLRVDQQGPPQAVANDGSVLGRDGVSRQALSVPARDLRLVRQDLERVVVLAHGDGLALGGRLQEGNPLLLHELSPELLREGADVADEGSREEGVSDDQPLLRLQVANAGGPPAALASQGVGEPLREFELHLALVRGLLCVVPVLVGGVVLLGELVQPLLQVLHLALNLG